MTDIKWQQPPADGRTRNGSNSKWPAIFAALRENPGEWALVHHGAPSVTRDLKLGLYNGSQQGEFEATSRRQADGKFDIYARYVGEVSA